MINIQQVEYRFGGLWKIFVRCVAKKSPIRHRRVCSRNKINFAVGDLVFLGGDVYKRDRSRRSCQYYISGRTRDIYV